MRSFDQHIHSWQITKIDKQMVCLDLVGRYSCGVIAISQQEYTKRRNEWELYYPNVITTKAYKRFIAQKKAYKENNFKLVGEFTQKAKEQIEGQDYELPIPSQPDPLFEKSARKLVII